MWFKFLEFMRKRHFSSNKDYLSRKDMDIYTDASGNYGFEEGSYNEWFFGQWTAE